MRQLALAVALVTVAFSLPAAARRPKAYQRAVELFWQGKVEEAVALYRQQLERTPGDAALLTDLGLALGKLGRTAEAERELRRAIAKEPGRWYAYANLAEVLAQDEARFVRHDEIAGLLTDALLQLPPKASVARAGLTLSLARFERATGRAHEARGWLDSLPDEELNAVQRDGKARLYDALAADERARALEDWPEPEVSAKDRATLAEAERLYAAALPAEALRAVDPLARAHPTWRGPRWLRARSLHSLRFVDEAARELSVLVRLAPSHGEAWRLLGEVLASDGGLLEADRADEALRQALALEPAWVELWLLRARVALRRGRPADALRFVDRVRKDPVLAHEKEVELSALGRQARARLEAAGAPPAQHARAEPSAEARELLRRAQEILARPDRADDAQAGELLEQALLSAPAFLEAAGTLYSLTGEVRRATLAALWDDGPALLDFAGQIERLAKAPRAPPSVAAPSPGQPIPAAQLVRPWVERAVELGAPEARFARARLEVQSGDRPGALRDLVEYVASPQPQRLAEAKELRAALTPPPRADPAQVQALLKLVEDKPTEAQGELLVRCERPPRAGSEQDAARLTALGRIAEFNGDLPAALLCHAAALKLQPHAGEALVRLAKVAARSEAQALAPVRPQLEEASALGISAADWALARDLDASGRPSEALAKLDRFLGRAAADDPARKLASSARARILGARDVERRESQRRLLVASAAAALCLLALLLVLFHGSTVEGALRKRAGLFPAVARAVAEIRHDVIKHRASVLSALADPAFAAEARDDVARSLLSPEPTSEVVAAIYEKLRLAARAQGVTLRRLGREPTFGALARDLRRAEEWLRKGRGRFDAARADSRLREIHSEKLGALLRLGPRTRLDAPAITSWIRDVEAELRQGGSSWTSPALQLAGMEVEFPVERAALSTIFANLLRNAQAAAQEAGDKRVVVRLAEERDAAGRRVVTLLVGDSSPRALTLEAIESRESGRGLAIVRDLTREWHGHLVVRPEAGPWTKSVGACFVALQIERPA